MAGPLTQDTRRMRNNKLSQFTLSDVDRMERMRSMGMSCRAIAEAHGCTPQYIAHLIEGRTGPRYREPKQEQPTPKPIFTIGQADIRSLSRRGYKPNDIAAITRVPYREVLSALGLAQ